MSHENSYTKGSTNTPVFKTSSGNVQGITLVALVGFGTYRLVRWLHRNSTGRLFGHFRNALIPRQQAPVPHISETAFTFDSDGQYAAYLILHQSLTDPKGAASLSGKALTTKQVDEIWSSYHGRSAK